MLRDQLALLARSAYLVGLVLLLLSPGVAHADPGGDFVRVEGHRFVVEGAPYHPMGANVAVMHGPAHRAHARETLRAAAADGMTVVRLWALGEYPADAPAWTDEYAFRRGPDGWLETTYRHLDEVLAEARLLGLRVIVVLANRWAPFGGAARYLTWADVPFAEAAPTGRELRAFYESPSVEAHYRAHVERLVGRENTVTGVPYRDDPTVFAWELINEAEAFGLEAEAAYERWVRRQTAFVSALDPNHLLSAGHIGYRTPAERRLWRRVCALPQVSYCDSHAYPIENGVTHPAVLARWVDDRVQLAQHVVGKPLLFGEVGVRTDRQRLSGRSRAAWWDVFMRRVLYDGAGGALAWTYLPSEGPRRAFGIYAGGSRSRQTRDVRRVLAGWATRARRLRPADRNPALGPARGARPFVDLRQRGPGPARVFRLVRRDRLAIDPAAYAWAEFDRFGLHESDVDPNHFWGAGVGEVSYRVRLRGPVRLTLGLRLSSELDGAGDAAPDARPSSIVVLWSGREVARVEAPVDDGVGAWVEVPLRGVFGLGASIERLTLRAEGPEGLCLYGETQTGRAGLELRAEPADRILPPP